MLEKTPKALSFKRQGSMKGGRNEVQHEEMTQMAEMVRTNTSKNLKRQLTSSGVSQGQDTPTHQDPRADADME
jgi:hypothetical protein